MSLRSVLNLACEIDPSKPLSASECVFGVLAVASPLIGLTLVDALVVTLL